MKKAKRKIKVARYSPWTRVRKIGSKILIPFKWIGRVCTYLTVFLWKKCIAPGSVWLWGQIDDFLRRNLLDQYGRIDTGRIGNILGLYMMYKLSIYVTNEVISGQITEAQVSKILSLGAPGSILMGLYRIKDKWRPKAGNDMVEPKEPGVKRERNSLPSGG